MGSAVSVVEDSPPPSKLSKDEIEKLAGDKFDEGRFNEAADEEGKVSVEAYEEEREKVEAAVKIQARSRGRRQRGMVLTGGADTSKPIKERIKEAFAKFDRDGSGEIGVEEVKWYLPDDDAAQSLMGELDNIQKDGSVSLDEWQKYFDEKGDAAEAYVAMLENIVVTATVEEQKSAALIQARARGRNTRKGALLGAAPDAGKDIDQRVVECFDKFDNDGSGFLEVEELRVYLGNDKGAEKMMIQFDNIHTDGKIDKEEFQKYFKNMQPQDLVPTYLATLENMVVTVSPSQAATTIQSIQRGKNARKNSDGAQPNEA